MTAAAPDIDALLPELVALRLRAGSTRARLDSIMAAATLAQRLPPADRVQRAA